jgi:hypothetical protein
VSPAEQIDKDVCTGQKNTGAECVEQDIIAQFHFACLPRSLGQETKVNNIRVHKKTA